MKFWTIKLFYGGDNAASNFVRFYLFFKCFRFCIDLQFFLKGGKPFVMFSPLYLMQKSNHTSFLFALFVSSLCVFPCFYFYVSVFLHIYVILHDMLKCNKNIHKSLELKSDSNIPKEFCYLLHWKPFKNDEKCFLSHLKSSSCSQDI